MKTILRVNMSDRSISPEDSPGKYDHMGGRWLSSSMVADEVPPTCHPLGPANKLVFAPGIVSGTAALNNFSLVHYQHLIADVLHHAQVLSHVDIRDPLFFL